MSHLSQSAPVFTRAGKPLLMRTLPVSATMNNIQWFNNNSDIVGNQSPFDGMELTVLGSASAYAGRWRSTSAYALRLPGTYVATRAHPMMANDGGAVPAGFGGIVSQTWRCAHWVECPRRPLHRLAPPQSCARD